MAGPRMAGPLFALREGYSPAAVGVLLALFALTQVFLALPSGRYADRHGLKRPVGLRVIAAVVGAGAAVAFPVFPVLCLAALVPGGVRGPGVCAGCGSFGPARENHGWSARVSWRKAVKFPA